MENGEYVLGVFLDFSKAFHTVDPNILIAKNGIYWHLRNCTGLDERIYSQYRKQYLVYINTSSCNFTISCVGPQGSISGPQLFF